MNKMSYLRHIIQNFDAMPLPHLVRFDWAMKRLLRHKSNFVVLEGFLSSLFEEKITIRNILESESNKEEFTDKFNRVDLLAEDSKGELIIIEVQNNRELDYFLRMLYGVSKAVTEYISEGDLYEKIRKVYSVNIVYFDLGQGTDYVYHGRTEFRGIHNHDVLQLSKQQRERFICQDAGDLFPEYYVLRVNEFDKKAVTPLDEWIVFLKTGEIGQNSQAPGLAEARERLKFSSLDKKDRAAYLRNIEDLRVQRSVMDTAWMEGLEEGRITGRAEGKIEGKIEGRIEGRIEGKAEGRAEGLTEGEAKGRIESRLEIARNMKSLGMTTELITQATGLSTKEIEQL